MVCKRLFRAKRKSSWSQRMRFNSFYLSFYARAGGQKIFPLAVQGDRDTEVGEVYRCLGLFGAVDGVVERDLKAFLADARKKVTPKVREVLIRVETMAVRLGGEGHGCGRLPT